MSFVRVFTLLSAALAIAQAAQQGNGSSPFMLITSWKPDSIYRFELESHTYVTIPVREVHYPRSIDYDATEDRIYWTSIFWTGEKITDSEIYSSYLNGTDSKIIRGLGQKSYVSGIAVDPFTRQLFYTDDFLDHIAFLNLTTLNTSVIVNTNLDEPRAIVLDTSKRVLYWTDWGYIGKIEKANFDGSNRTLLIRTDSPCGLALDIKNSHLYWTVYGTNVDVGVISASRVERSNLEGGDRKIIYAKELSAFYGLGLVGNHLYLTDWTSAKYQTTLSHLIRLKTDGTEVTKILSVAGRMNDIYIFQAVETTASTTQVTTSHGHHDITCTESRMEFSIPLSSPHTSETATLSDPNCQINLTRTHVRGGVDLNSCGTTVQFQNDSVIFRNAIIFSAPASSSLGSNGSDDSVSQYQDIIPIECVYNRIATVHLSYMPVVRRVLFTESGVGQFSFNIQQFWDASFTSVVSDRAYPLRLEQDADIFIQLSVGSEGQPVAGHKEIGMEVQQCLVSPSSSVIEAQLHYYPLIQDGCPASSDVHIIPNTNASDSTVMRFRFRAVNFFDPSSSSSSSLVFVHCRMGLCLTGSCKPSAWTCLTPPARRVRRDVDQSRRAAHQLSTGPFLIMADEASASSSSTTATVMAVVSTSVATVAIVVAAIALIALRRRRTTARN